MVCVQEVQILNVLCFLREVFNACLKKFVFERSQMRSLILF
jgi:hypothetical protein